MMPANDRAKVLAVITTVITAVALIVLAIDMQIKKDLLKLAEKTQLDLLYIRKLVRDVEVSERVPERPDLRDSPNGTVRRDDVAHVSAEVEDKASATQGVPGNSAPRKRADKRVPANPSAEAITDSVPSTDK